MILMYKHKRFGFVWALFATPHTHTQIIGQDKYKTNILFEC